ncbi:MAG: DUF5605 domain-containing protein [Mobilitalea sp.]
MSDCVYTKIVEKWGTFEVTVQGKSDKNPFVDYKIGGTFRSKNEIKKVDGFYDGEGRYMVRFMPSFEEEYEFELEGNFSNEKYTGQFHVVKPGTNNHGPVHVENTYHFAYEDGKPYYSIGTTCYVWALQAQELQEQTLETLKNSAFNKIRFCVFPKHYDYNFNEPITYPYVGTPCDNSGLTKENFYGYMGKAPGNDWDFEQFNPLHFQLFEKRIQDLMELGIEADLIIMHPYDRWGFSEMSAKQDDLYWNYVIARFSAYRNVWWSLANEYDLLFKKTMEDWERYASIICSKDAYNHLRSIHNCRAFYNYNRPWITHCSLQRQDIYKSTELTEELRISYHKPIVWDEIAYEGNIQHGWGNISGKELIRRFWEAACRGGYAGHGETFMHPQDILWWSHGGTLHGESPDRLKFLSKIMQEIPGFGLKPIQENWDEVAATVDSFLNMQKPYNFYLFYYGFNRPSFRNYYFDDSSEYKVELLDTWEMTITEIGKFKGRFTVQMPGKEYMAVRITKII